MRRFIYAPQVNVYVQTEEFGVLDLSPDIISGSVTRRLNAVSSAELMLNNKPILRGGRYEGRYLRRIKPMDKIVIFLTRVHKPTLVFSGYVDDAPFDQYAPGPVRIAASCTLKRLLHTYFDPGLPYVRKYLSQFGWGYEETTGTMFSSDFTTLANFDIQGGLGHILRSTLHDIGGWPIGVEGERANTVHVYGLPESFIKKTTEVFKNQVEAVEQQRAEIERFLKTLLTYDGSFGDETTNLHDFEFESQYADNKPLPRSLAGEYKGLIYGPKFSLSGFAEALKVEAAKEGHDLGTAELQNAQTIFDLVRGNAFSYGNWSTKAACGFVGAAYGESSLNANAVNSSSQATGLFQLLSAGYYGADGIIADVMSDLGVDDPGAPALAGPEAKNPTYNTLSILRDSIGQANRAAIEASDTPHARIVEFFERPGAGYDEPDGGGDPVKAAYYAKGFSMYKAAMRAVNATKQAAKPTADQEGQVGDIRVPPGFFPDTGKRNFENYTMRIKGNPYGDNRMIFRIVETNSKLNPNTIEMYVPGAADDSTPQAQAWKNTNVILETSSGKAQRFVYDSVKEKVQKKIPDASFLYPIVPYTGYKHNVTSHGYWGHNRGDHTHAGNDIAANDGTPLIACVNGTIIVNTTQSGIGGGNYIVIQQEGSTRTFVYMHMRERSHLPVGSRVNMGDLVGHVGSSGTSDGFSHLHFEVHPNGGFGYAGSANPAPLLESAWAQGNKVTSIDSSANGDYTKTYGSTGVRVTQEDIGQIATSVFWGNVLTFPTTGIEAVNFRGERALANDIPLMQWVEFICTSSGRAFQSMPRGDFMAFYPDYFNWAGESPYWRISDLETIELNINISDQEIATHVFTTGDTLYNDSIDLVDKLSSTVASVETIGTFADFIHLEKDPNLFARQFLERYGARPIAIENVQIKHSLLQFMYGWQTFLNQWAKQYVCQAQFTFMPELYPGGLVEFTGKDLIMYVEEVTHTFDLASGFSTTASLTAPSTRGKDSGSYNHGMVLTKGGLARNNNNAPATSVVTTGTVRE